MHLKFIEYIATLFLAFLTTISFAAEKPNFLFVVVDDMAPDAIFHNRFEFLETPNLQRLADEGTVHETNNVATSYPENVKELRAQINEWWLPDHLQK